MTLYQNPRTVMDAFNTVGAAERAGGAGHTTNTIAHAVADLIQELGYVVRCGVDVEWKYIVPESNFVTAGTGSWVSDHGFVILSIRRPSGEYIYGASEEEHRKLFRRGPVVGSIRSCMIEFFPLLRTDERRHSPSNVKFARSGELRTIGNSFPPDIVNALEMYPCADTLPSWEFLIPEVPACPCPEKEVDGQVAEHVAEHGGGAGAALPNGINEKEDSDSSSDDEDD